MRDSDNAVTCYVNNMEMLGGQKYGKSNLVKAIIDADWKKTKWFRS